MRGSGYCRREAALAAFRFANQAMYLQRVHTLAAEACTRDDTLSLDAALTSVGEPKNHSWRPFQLAFVLLNLPALADPTHRTGRWRHRARRSVVVPDRGRQDRGLPGTDRLRARRAETAGRAGRLRHPRGCGRADAVHAAAAHYPAVPAGRGLGVCLRDTPPQRFGSVGAGSVSYRLVGWRAGDAEPDR